MTAVVGSDFDRLLLDAVDALVHDPDVQVPAGRVIGAVARAKIRARELYRSNGIELPPTEDLVALIAGMARQSLTTSTATEDGGLPAVTESVAVDVDGATACNQ